MLPPTKAIGDCAEITPLVVATCLKQIFKKELYDLTEEGLH
jgi:hypothetical protein